MSGYEEPNRMDTSGSSNLNSSSVALPPFREQPEAYLDMIAHRPPSRELMIALSGLVAAAMKTNNTASQIAILYLQAAAQHLEAGFVSSSMSSIGITDHVDVVASSAARQHPPPPPHHHHQQEQHLVSSSMMATVGTDAMESERRRRSDDYYTVVDTIGHVVTQCTPRSSISESGILHVMANLIIRSYESRVVSSQQTVPWTGLLPLSNLQVEFLQACVYSGQYRYAEQIIHDTWPLPCPAVTVRHVLRYYYLRGTIHMGCANWKMAVRSFWTCLSVPSDICSAIAIAAWKKLVLIQCLVKSHQILDTSSILSLPSGASSCYGRYLDRASSLEQHQHQHSMAHHSHGSQMPHEDRPEITHMVEGTEGEATAEESKQSSHQSKPSSSGNMNRIAYPSLGVRVYMDLVQSFVKIQRTTFAELVSRHSSLFLRDGNMGMVKQCENELIRRHLIHLSRIYCTMTLSQLSSMLELNEIEAQKLLLQASMERTWSVDIKDGVITFPVLTEPLGNELSEVEELMQLSNAVYKLDASLSSSPKYTSIVNRQNHSSSETTLAPRGVDEL